MKILLATLSILLLPLPTHAGITRLADGIYLLPGQAGPTRQPDGNSVIIESDKALLVVDSGRHPNHTAQLVAFARDARKPVTDIVNTHWHLDHISGNRALRNTWPALRIHASTALDGALDGFLAEYRDYLLKAIPALDDKPEQQAELKRELATLEKARKLAPDVPVTGSGVMHFGEREIEIHLEKAAVTAGDTWLYDRGTRTLVAGDLVTSPAPFFDTACIAGWQRAIEVIAEKDFVTLVPGHGRPMDRAGFEAWRSAFDSLLACSASDRDADDCAGDWIVNAGIDEEERAYARDLLRYYFANVLRGNVTRQEAFCNAAG